MGFQSGAQGAGGYLPNGMQSLNFYGSEHSPVEGRNAPERPLRVCAPAGAAIRVPGVTFHIPIPAKRHARNTPHSQFVDIAEPVRAHHPDKRPSQRVPAGPSNPTAQPLTHPGPPPPHAYQAADSPAGHVPVQARHQR